MFVLITEYGQQVSRGNNLSEMLIFFYSFQPNDDTDIYVYDITNDRSTKIDYDKARVSLDSMDDLVESISWTTSYLGEDNEST